MGFIGVDADQILATVRNFDFGSSKYQAFGVSTKCDLACLILLNLEIRFP